MQKLVVEATFPTDAATTWDIFESERFRERLAAETGITAELLSESTEGKVQVQTFLYKANRELPTVAAKALGSRHLTYEQTNRFDSDTGRLDWNIVMPMVRDRVFISGFTTILPHGDGCKRRVEGTIEVKMRFIGGQIEKAVVGEFEKSMGRVNDIVRQMITDGQA